MDRRSFLQASAAIIVSGIAVPVAAKVETTVWEVSQDSCISPEIYEFLEGEKPHEVLKYLTALELYDQVVAAKKFPYILHPRFEKLMEFVHANFEIPEFNDVNKALAREILNGGDIPGLMERFRQTPPAIQESVWPIALMIGLLRWEAIPLNHRQVKQFTVFHERYGRFILEA